MKMNINKIIIQIYNNNIFITFRMTVDKSFVQNEIQFDRGKTN